MATTLKANMIIPEVLAALINVKLTDNMVFMPLASIDATLEGQAGDTIKFPKYAYIGDAAIVNENGQIVPVALSQSSVEVSVAKAAKAVQITDEVMLSAYGDPMGEAASQIVTAINNKIDNDMLTALEGVSVARQFGTTATISPDLIADALTVFGEDEAGVKAFMVSPTDVATLRKDDDFIKATEIGQNMLLSGAIGELWGCQIIAANKIKTNSTTGEFHRFIVKPGALRLIRKRGTIVEVEREAEYQRQTVYATHHYAAYLYDESKVVMIRQFTALKDLAAGDVVSTAGEESGGTLLDIKVPAPLNYRWVYKLGEADVTNAAFGTALTGYTDWTSKTTEIAGSTNTKAHVCLVGADNKPVKQLNVTLVKAE